MELTEREWSDTVEMAAAANGWRIAFASVSRSVAGWPDLTLMHPIGQVIFVELKTDAGQLSKKQRTIHREMAEAGHEVYVWRPRDSDHVREVLGKFGKLPSVLPKPLRENPLIEQPTPPIQIKDVLDVVSDHFNLDPRDIVGPRRDARYSWPRQVAMYLSRTKTAHSLPSIGATFHRDHTTVLHACRKIEADPEALKLSTALGEKLEDLHSPIHS